MKNQIMNVEQTEARLADYRGVYTQTGDAAWAKQVQMYRQDQRIQAQLEFDQKLLKDNPFNVGGGATSKDAAGHLIYWAQVQNTCQEMGHTEIADFVSTWGKLLQAEMNKGARYLTPNLIKKACLRAQLATKMDSRFLGAGKDILITAWSKGLQVAEVLGEKEEYRLLRTVHTDRVKKYYNNYSKKSHSPNPVTEASYVLADVLPCIPSVKAFETLANRESKETLLRFIPILKPLMITGKNGDEWKQNLKKACGLACAEIETKRSQALSKKE